MERRIVDRRIDPWFVTAFLILAFLAVLLIASTTLI